MNRPFRLTPGLMSVLVPAISALAYEPIIKPAPLGSLLLDISAGLRPEPPAPTPSSTESAPNPAPSPQPSQPPDPTLTLRPTYGHSGAQAWTFGALYANDFHNAHDVNIHGAYSIFLADEFEFAVEVAAWYSIQPGDDTAAVSGSMIFRWHYLHADDYNWTLFADAGIGVLVGFDDIPDGGTGFNFVPRLGGGFTKALGPEANSPRLMLGARWHHISNARIDGDARNPGRDAVAVYAAIVFPF